MNKILIIPDSFKGTMSSREVGRILEEEARACWPEAAVSRVEVADGGEGTVDAFLAVLPGEKRRCRVHGPFGEWVDAAYGRMGETAVIEMAAAAGLPLAAGRPGAGQASTYGVGELLADAVAHGARRIVLGLGGSATNDGGAGAAAALGVRFYRANGEAFVPVWDTLAEIARIDAAPARQALRGVTVTAICDIDNPLCGPQGAAAVFAPQKGAAPADLPRLDAGLRHLAEVAGPEAGLDLLALPGAELAGIRTVVSHQQALAQSSPFLKSHGLEARPWGNTADAARHVAESGDKSLAAIASAQTAELYGLQILVKGVNEDGDNTTRFLVVARADAAAPLPPAPGRRLALLFTVDHKPGKLANVIRLIGEQGFNMENIKSRPLPHVPFEYYFYVQLVCPEENAPARCAALLESLEAACRTVRTLGVFETAPAGEVPM